MHEMQISGGELQVFAALWSTNRQNDFLLVSSSAKMPPFAAGRSKPSRGTAERGFPGAIQVKGRLVCSRRSTWRSGMHSTWARAPADALRLYPDLLMFNRLTCR